MRTRFLVLDVVCVLVFALVGRASHEHGIDPAGLFGTAWPFLVALAAGWVVLLGRRNEGGSWGEGAFLWLVTLAFGMLIRSRMGGGVEPSFIAVAGAFLAATMLGGRWLLGRRARA